MFQNREKKSFKNITKWQMQMFLGIRVNIRAQLTFSLIFNLI